MTENVSRRIVLTGASQGLGRAMLEGFISHGHRVAACSRSAHAIEELHETFGEPHHFRVVDVADDNQVRDWAQTVLDDFGIPDLVINNAAIINPNNPLWQITSSDFDRLFAVNVSGTASVIRHFLPAMLSHFQSHHEQAGIDPVIVNFSSGWGRSVAAEVAPYCASKWAIEGLTKALAEELPGHFCAVPLNPGIINTSMLRSCFADGADGFPVPSQWAQVAVPFILSFNRRHSGQSLSVPGM
ncbi:MAG: SDR family oxidoreductase [Planctomycetaceae bacterium]